MQEMQLSLGVTSLTHTKIDGKSDTIPENLTPITPVLWGDLAQ
jgi:hypothetical protein